MIYCRDNGSARLILLMLVLTYICFTEKLVTVEQHRKLQSTLLMYESLVNVGKKNEWELNNKPFPDAFPLSVEVVTIFFQFLGKAGRFKLNSLKVILEFRI